MSTNSCPPHPATPVLKWAGGKRRLIGQYQQHFPTKFGSYFEPFFGGGAVFFWLFQDQRLRKKRVVLNDINPELVNFYRVLKDHLDELVEHLKRHQADHCSHHYYQTRALDRATLTEVERAATLLYLNRTCFNGLYRVNSKGQFNVPMGTYKNPVICDPEGLLAASRALAGVDLTLGPYHAVASNAAKGDLVYFDPPYVPLNPTSSFTSYTRENFGHQDQIDLATTFRSLAKRGVKVVLSNSDTPTVRELYHGFEQHPIQASRAINSKADRRQKVAELLITS